jgi:hypothetical protein
MTPVIDAIAESSCEVYVMSRRAKYANAGFDERLERSAADAAGRRQKLRKRIDTVPRIGFGHGRYFLGGLRMGWSAPLRAIAAVIGGVIAAGFARWPGACRPARRETSALRHRCG